MITVRLDQFEGPLGLLLYLIRREEMDISNIPIHRITSQYLEHIKRMRELDLEVAGDFVAMAATLIHIKSRMLLPQYDENGEPIEQVDDPRKELVQKLLEYQKFQEASKKLNERPLLGRDIWARATTEDIPMAEGEIILDEGGLFAMISLYRKLMKQVKKNVHQVRAKGQSIAARILEIRDRLMPGHRVTLKELIAQNEWSTNKLLITFLSMLELTKMGFTSLFQTETYGDIYIDTLKPIERDVIERVEEYDKAPDQAAIAADELVADAGGRDLHDLNQTPEEQLGLLGEESANPDLATDDEILAAEHEMGLEGEGFGAELAQVDQALAAFSLEIPTSDVVAAITEANQEAVVSDLAADEPAVEISADLQQGVTIDTPVEAPAVDSPKAFDLLDDQQFELAWADFIENEPVTAPAAETPAEVIAAEIIATEVAAEIAAETEAAVAQGATVESDISDADLLAAIENATAALDDVELSLEPVNVEGDLSVAEELSLISSDESSEADDFVIVDTNVDKKPESEGSAT